MIRLHIEPADGEEETRSFYRWLREDPDARREYAVSLESRIHPGEMGAVDVLTAVVTQLTSIGTLAVAFAAWRDSRARPSAVKISVGGASIEFGEGSAEQLTVVLMALIEKQSQPQSQPPAQLLSQAPAATELES
jgi:hypothetical protein